MHKPEREFVHFPIGRKNAEKCAGFGKYESDKSFPVSASLYEVYAHAGHGQTAPGVRLEKDRHRRTDHRNTIGNIAKEESLKEKSERTPIMEVYRKGYTKVEPWSAVD